MVCGGLEYVRCSPTFIFWWYPWRYIQFTGMCCNKTMGSLVVTMRTFPKLRVKCRNCPDIWYLEGTCNGCHVGENSCESEPECLKEDREVQ